MPPGAGQAVEGEAKAAPLTPEQRSEMIRRRIEERRRQMREEAERNRKEPAPPGPAKK